MSIKIYFDMDGVLADFDVAATHLSNGRTDLNNQTKLMTDDLRAAKIQRWQRIERTERFWEDMPIVPNIKDLLQVAQQLGEIFVLTRVPSAKNFVAGDSYVSYIANAKKEWIAKNMSDFFPPENVIAICGASGEKEALIKPTLDHILVDDRAGNVADWESAGGQGVVFQSVARSITDLQNLL